MRTIILGSAFKRDTKRMQRCGRQMGKLRELVLLLEQELPLHYKDHALGGDWRRHRDSHIEPDWLLIYKVDENDLYLVRTGSHSDLF